MDELTYRKAKEQAVWIDWPNGSWLELHGNDRGRFLHNLCTNDVLGLPSGGGCEAFFTNVQGKVVGFGTVHAEEDCISIMTESGQAEVLLPHLDKYLIREDVDLSNTTGQQRELLVVGPNSLTLARELGVADGVMPWSYLGLNKEFEARIYQIDCFAMPAFLARCPDTQLGSLRTRLDETGVARGDPDVADVLRIENGFPRYGIDISEANLPQEVDRNGSAISFTKGCYLGQETVARIDALGHVNKRLCRVSFASSGVPAVGTELRSNGKSVGSVTSSVWSFDEGSVGLAYVRRGHDEAGSVLQATDTEATVQ